MAAFFSPRVYSPYAPHHHQQGAAEPSFHGLFRLLEDWDNHHNNNAGSSSTNTNANTAVGNKQQQRQQQRQARRQRLQHQQPEQPAFFTPRFDVKETDTAYELFGDLPGVDKKDVSIEFSDPQTLIVKGHVERSFSSSSVETRDASGKLITAEAHDDEDDAVMVDHSAGAGAAEDDHHAETSSQRSFQATVEDDNEDGGITTTATPAQAKTSDKPTTTDTTVATTTPSTDEQLQQPPQQPTHKYWISERSFGSFSRTFAFPERLDLDGVSASLENGVLALTVPKARKYEARRISLL